MKLSQAKMYLPIIQAAAEGKMIQVNVGGIWCDCDETVFDWDAELYRIKPAKTVRAWTPLEGVGKVCRSNITGNVGLIIGFNFSIGVFVVPGDFGGLGFSRTPQYMLENCTHTTNGGATWLPCGVETEE